MRDLRSALAAVLSHGWIAGLVPRVDEQYRCGMCGQTYDRRPRVCHACGSATAPDP